MSRETATLSRESRPAEWAMPAHERLLVLLAEAWLASRDDGRPQKVSADDAFCKIAIEDRILQVIREKSSASPRELQIRYSVKPSTLHRVLARLESDREIVAMGETRNRRY